MKKYIKPEIKFALFATENIITDSTPTGEKYRMLKTKVNNNEGTDYGSQNVSIFNNQQEKS